MSQRILIVDDEPDILELISLRLQKEGFLTCCSESGADALRQIDHFDPELVILDIMMPGMDGLEVCMKIREMDLSSEIPILFLTAKGEDFDLLQGYLRGADGYLVKPVEISTLLDEIGRIIPKS